MSGFGEDITIAGENTVYESAGTADANKLYANGDATPLNYSLVRMVALQIRLESAITNLQTNETNLSAARSRIEDADYATEVANMTRAQILQSVLSLLG